MTGRHPMHLPPDPAQAAAPYEALGLPPEAVRPVAQTEALLEDPEIVAALRGAGREPWTRARGLQAGLGLLLTTAALLAVLLLLPGNLFSLYRPPAPADTPRPQPYPDVAAAPILFRDAVRDINADLASPARWRSAYTALKDLALAPDAPVEPPPEVRAWAATEALVLMASRELPPDAYAPDDAEAFHAALTALAAEAPDAAAPFRAGAARARLLAARPLPRDADARRAALEETAAAIEALRRADAVAVDANRDLLAAEAETHIGLLPDEYRAGDPRLDYHWRRAAHAILRLYDLYGRSDPAVRALDLRRWQAAYRYFDYTLFTLDPARLGRIASARLDGVDVTRAEIRERMEALQP